MRCHETETRGSNQTRNPGEKEEKERTTSHPHGITHRKGTTQGGSFVGHRVLHTPDKPANGGETGDPGQGA